MHCDNFKVSDISAVKNIIPLIFILLSFQLKAQTNLVPNPSFEEYSQCPDNNGYIHYCNAWINCGETPDYDNSCSQGPFSVPYNFIGYQPASTGSAYCQLCTYSILGLYRESIGVPLFQPMILGHTYQVSFKCSPGSPGYGYCLQTNKLGIRFSTVAYDSTHPAPIDNFAHIYSEAIITDTAEWTTIGGTLIADSAYTFLIISNFFDDANTDTLVPGFQCAGFAYYFIDDVSVSDAAAAIDETAAPDVIVSVYGNVLHIISFEPVVEVKMFNTLGQTCYQTTTSQFNTTAFSCGLYILQIKTPTQTFIKKCIIPKTQTPGNTPAF